MVITAIMLVILCWWYDDNENKYCSNSNKNDNQWTKGKI